MDIYVERKGRDKRTHIHLKKLDFPETLQSAIHKKSKASSKKNTIVWFFKVLSVVLLTDMPVLDSFYFKHIIFSFV